MRHAHQFASTLDESGRALAADALAQLLQVLTEAQSGTVRARALPMGELPAVTILAFDDSEEQHEVYLEIGDPRTELAR